MKRLATSAFACVVLAACAGPAGEAPAARVAPARQPGHERGLYERPSDFLTALAVSWNGVDVCPTIVFDDDLDTAAAEAALRRSVVDAQGRLAGDEPWDLHPEVRMRDLWAHALGELVGRPFPLWRGELHERRDRRLLELLEATTRPEAPR